MDPNYRFYFMFLLRNTLDRILPFLVLLTMNIMIVKAVKEDERQKLQKESVVSNGKSVNVKSHRRNVKDATRALISLVSIYLLSQSLQVKTKNIFFERETYIVFQVFLTVWETINRSSLEDGFPTMYSYLNDIVSIFTLLARYGKFKFSAKSKTSKFSVVFASRYISAAIG